MPSRRVLLTGALLVVVAVAVTTWRATAADSRPEPQPSTVDEVDPPRPMVYGASAGPPPWVAPRPLVSVHAMVEAAERAAPPGMTLGVAVLDTRTGELAAGRDGGRQFYSASLSKLIVVVDMFDQKRALTQRDLALAGRALSLSDDGAMNVLWGKFDGPGAVRRIAGRLGLTGTRPPADTSEWGETLVTATDYVKIYQHILRDLAPEGRDVITGALAAAQHTAADGFDQYFGLLAKGASGERYAKQGWVSYLPSRYYLHSAGVVKEYAIALLSTNPANSQTSKNRLSTVANAATAML